MSLWHWTFFFLFLTALVGLVLFAGYTMRVKIRYPLVLVVSHVSGATVTFLLFTLLLIKQAGATHVAAYIFLVISYVILAITFISGLYFFFKYDARRRGMRVYLIIGHLVSASLTFIMGVSSLAALQRPPSLSHQYFGGAMYNVHKHQSVHHHDPTG